MLKASQIKALRDKFIKNNINLPKIKFNFSKSIKKEFYRKSIHLSSLWIPALIYFTDIKTSFTVFLALFAADIILEYGNHKKWRWARKTFGRLFFKTLRNKERLKKKSFEISGSIYVLIASMACVCLFSKEVAMVSLTVMLISDTFAAIFGKIYGTRRVRINKSMEGTIAFFISSLLVMLVYNPLFTVCYESVIACFAATLVEVYDDKIRVDDNLSIPLAVGLILTFI